MRQKALAKIGVISILSIHFSSGIPMSDLNMYENENEFIWLDFELLERFMTEVLQGAGVPLKDARICAEVLIQADKLGIDSHGINRLKPIYYDRIKAGILNPITKIEVLRQSPATAVLDGNNGMGMVVSHRAMEMCIEKAKKYGLGMVAVRNSSHYGIAGYWGLMAQKEGLIGITGTNARPSIAPTFGVENMLGTNPLTFVMPTDEPFPFFLDCATSVSQRGKIEMNARAGKDTPAGWVVDRKGNTVTDSELILSGLLEGEMALLPLGGLGEETSGYKGYGYATVVEILSSALQGGGFLKMLTGESQGKKVPYNLGHFFQAIDISSFMGLDEFKKTTGDILRQLRASRKMPGTRRIFTPGEKEYEHWLIRKDQGVPINRNLLTEIIELIDELGLEGYKLPEFPSG